MNRLRSAALLVLVPALLCLPTSLAMGDDVPVAWETSKDGRGDYRVGQFEVADAECAYKLMAEPVRLVAALKHLREIRVHEDRGDWQDATFVEHFFLIGRVETRYHRRLDPGVGDIDWVLVEGRALRHDGHWRVRSLEGKRGTVDFGDILEAKSSLQQGIVRRVQKKTMPEIVAATLLTCGR